VRKQGHSDTLRVNRDTLRVNLRHTSRDSPATAVVNRVEYDRQIVL